MKKFAALLLSLCLMLTVALASAETITVAFNPEYPPFEYVEGDQYAGYDVDLINAIAEKAGFEVAFEAMDFDAVIAAVTTNVNTIGVSGISSDSRDIEKAAAEGNPRAQLVTKITAYQIKKFIGAYTAAMDGIDALVFTAGLGENNPELRSRVCAGLTFLGIKIDEELNAVSHHQPNIVKLSTDDSKVLVYLIPTNEEKVIAQDTERLARKALGK